MEDRTTKGRVSKAFASQLDAHVSAFSASAPKPTFARLGTLVIDDDGYGAFLTKFEGEHRPPRLNLEPGAQATRVCSSLSDDTIWKICLPLDKKLGASGHCHHGPASEDTMCCQATRAHRLLAEKMANTVLLNLRGWDKSNAAT